LNRTVLGERSLNTKSTKIWIVDFSDFSIAASRDRRLPVGIIPKKSATFRDHDLYQPSE